PLPSVAARNSAFVFTLIKTTEADGTGAPRGSTTDPVNWAEATCSSRSMTRRTICSILYNTNCRTATDRYDLIRLKASKGIECDVCPALKVEIRTGTSRSRRKTAWPFATDCESTGLQFRYISIDPLQSDPESRRVRRRNCNGNPRGIRERPQVCRHPWLQEWNDLRNGETRPDTRRRHPAMVRHRPCGRENEHATVHRRNGVVLGLPSHLRRRQTDESDPEIAGVFPQAPTNTPRRQPYINSRMSRRRILRRRCRG